MFNYLFILHTIPINEKLFWVSWTTIEYQNFLQKYI
jgi:hypothetical protein